jgi:hypothetical protein
MKRKSITKKKRFEVFKRDAFTCQYCGEKAPDVFLEVDHIEPVSKGGTNDFLNLITACKNCNAGKSDRKLSDTTVIDKQRQQLEELQARKEQIEMMFQWQKGLVDLDDHVIDKLSEFWSEQVPGFGLNETGLKKLRKLKKSFSIEEIMEAIRISTEQYLRYDEDGDVTKESVENAWKKVGGICRNKKEEQEKPHMKRLYYIRGILRNRLSYLNEPLALQLMEEAIEFNATIESLEEHAKSVRNWTQWRSGIEQFIADQSEGYDTEAPDSDEG